MKPQRKVIHIVRHKPTGAEVPVVLKKVSKENVIEDYQEITDNRRAFTVIMLERRWDMNKEDVLALLQKYQVPAHVDYKDVQQLPNNQFPVDAAIFFEEYIYAIEKKTKMKHNKLKSRPVIIEKVH
jgi:ribosomal protein S8